MRNKNTENLQELIDWYDGRCRIEINRMREYDAAHVAIIRSRADTFHDIYTDNLYDGANMLGFVLGDGTRVVFQHSYGKFHEPALDLQINDDQEPMLRVIYDRENSSPAGAYEMMTHIMGTDDRELEGDVDVWDEMGHITKYINA